MWQRFTEPARKAIFYAQEEAGRLGENCVSTEHLLLGLLRENTAAVWTLDRLGVTIKRIRSEIERQVSRGDARLGQEMQLTPRARRVIDLAYDEARLLDNKYVGTEHLLLGMVRESEGLAGRVLAKLGLELERTRREVKEGQEARAKGRAPEHPPEPSKDIAAFREQIETSVIAGLLQTYADGQKRLEAKLDKLLKSAGEEN